MLSKLRTILAFVWWLFTGRNTAGRRFKRPESMTSSETQDPREW